MFWDIATLTVYFLLCLTVLTASLVLPPGSHPRWLTRLALGSVPFAFGIHIVTALLYAGLAARPGWLTALLAPKFLATAFASGASLLLILASWLARTGRLEIERLVCRRLATVITYALCATLLFSALEVFTAVYSGVPALERHALHLLLPGAHGGGFAWLMLASLGLDLLALSVLLTPGLRGRPSVMGGAGVLVITATLLEKGILFIPSGFSPSPLGESAGYHPSAIEALVAAGIYAAALLVFIALLGPAVAQARKAAPPRQPGRDSHRVLAAAADTEASAQPSFRSSLDPDPITATTHSLTNSCAT